MITDEQMERLPLTVEELARVHGLKRDGLTARAHTLYTGPREKVDAFDSDLWLRGATFERTSAETIAVA